MVFGIAADYDNWVKMLKFKIMTFYAVFKNSLINTFTSRYILVHCRNNFSKLFADS